MLGCGRRLRLCFCASLRASMQKEHQEVAKPMSSYRVTTTPERAASKRALRARLLNYRICHGALRMA